MRPRIPTAPVGGLTLLGIPAADFSERSVAVSAGDTIGACTTATILVEDPDGTLLLKLDSQAVTDVETRRQGAYAGVAFTCESSAAIRALAGALLGALAAAERAGIIAPAGPSLGGVP